MHRVLRPKALTNPSALFVWTDTMLPKGSTCVRHNVSVRGKGDVIVRNRSCYLYRSMVDYSRFLPSDGHFVEISTVAALSTVNLGEVARHFSGSPCTNQRLARAFPKKEHSDLRFSEMPSESPRNGFPPDQTPCNVSERVSGRAGAAAFTSCAAGRLLRWRKIPICTGIFYR